MGLFSKKEVLPVEESEVNFSRNVQEGVRIDRDEKTDTVTVEYAHSTHASVRGKLSQKDIRNFVANEQKSAGKSNIRPTLAARIFGQKKEAPALDHQPTSQPSQQTKPSKWNEVHETKSGITWKWGSNRF